MPLGSDTAKDIVLDATLGATQDSRIPDPLNLALFSADPTVNPGSEVTGGSYARVSIPKGSWDASSGGIKATNVDIDFPTSTAPWEAVANYCALMDASDNVWDSGQLGAPVSVTEIGIVVRFPAGSLTVTEL